MKDQDIEAQVGTAQAPIHWWQLVHDESSTL